MEFAYEQFCDIKMAHADGDRKRRDARISLKKRFEKE
jgi:hypothetical protein